LSVPLHNSVRTEGTEVYCLRCAGEGVPRMALRAKRPKTSQSEDLARA